MRHRVFSTAAVAAFAFAVALPSAAPAADGAEQLLARHAAYVGWHDGDGTVRSVRVTMEQPLPTPAPGATPDPLAATSLRYVTVRRGILYRQRAVGAVASEEGFTGSRFWRSNGNGNTVPLRARSLREALTSDLIDAEALSGVPATLRPGRSFDGKAVAVLRVAPLGGAVADVYVDPATGAFAGYTFEPDEPAMRVTEHVVSYAEFAPGKRYVSAVRGDEASQPPLRVTAFEPNVPVSDTDLHPPAPRATWTFGEPRTVPMSVILATPMYGSGNYRSVVFDAVVNGHIGRFLFDSGAASVLMSDGFARTAGVKDVARSAYFGVNGRAVRSTVGTVETFAIGGNTLHDLTISHAGDMFPGIDGIVGYDVLAAAIVDVDLDAKTITMLDPARYGVHVDKGAYAFPLDLSDFHAGVTVQVEGNLLSSVWLDSGDSFFVILPHTLQDRVRAVEDSQTIFGGVDGAGDQLASCSRLNEMQIGPYRYQQALSCFAPNDAFGTDGGLIGFDFLRHFNWTFDYPDGTVVLTPNHDR